MRPAISSVSTELEEDITVGDLFFNLNDDDMTGGTKDSLTQRVL